MDGSASIVNQPGYAFTGTESRAFQLSQAASVQQMQKEINIVTAEGDKVTLSYQSSDITAYTREDQLTYQGISVSDGTRSLNMEESTLSRKLTILQESQRSFSLTVEGDLSRQELKEIRKAVKAIDKLMRGSLAGKTVSPDSKQVSKLQGMKTLAGIDADYRYQQVVLQAQSSSRETEMTAVALKPENEAEAIENVRDVSRMIDKMARTIRSTEVDVSHFETPLRDMFTSIHKDLPDHGRRKDRQADLLNHVETGLANRLFGKMNSFGREMFDRDVAGKAQGFTHSRHPGFHGFAHMRRI